MADIYGSHFEYGGQSSRLYDLVIANLNTSRWTRLSGASESMTMYSKRDNKNYLLGDDHTKSPVSFDIEIVTHSGRCLESVECRQIEKWLFGHHNYQRLYFDTADDRAGETYEFINGIMHRNYLNCRLLNPEKLEGNGGVIGYKVQLEADSNMFWQDAITESLIVNNNGEDISTTVSLTVDTDFRDYIYPKVTITLGSVGGDITIINNSDDNTRQTKFVGISPHATVVMKGGLNYISGQYYEKFCDRNFIRLLDGQNIFTVLGDVDTIEFEYSARRNM